LPGVGDDLSNRDGEAREVDLGEEVSIGTKNCGRLAQAGREVIPDDDSRHKEEEGGNLVGGDLQDAAKDDLIDDRANEGLNEIPDRPHDGLLVHGDEVSPYAKENQVAVLPEFTEVDVEEGLLGGQDRGPLLRRG